MNSNYWKNPQKQVARALSEGHLKSSPLIITLHQRSRVGKIQENPHWILKGSSNPILTSTEKLRFWRKEICLPSWNFASASELSQVQMKPWTYAQHEHQKLKLLNKDNIKDVNKNLFTASPVLMHKSCPTSLPAQLKPGLCQIPRETPLAVFLTQAREQLKLQKTVLMRISDQRNPPPFAWTFR